MSLFSHEENNEVRFIYNILKACVKACMKSIHVEQTNIICRLKKNML